MSWSGTGYLMGYQPDKAPETSTWRWATVLDVDPLTIILDGDTLPLAAIPESLTDPRTLMVNMRVWCQLFGRRVIIHGPSVPSPLGPTANAIRVGVGASYSWGSGAWEGMRNGVQRWVRGDPGVWTNIHAGVGVTVRDAGFYSASFTFTGDMSAGGNVYGTLYDSLAAQRIAEQVAPQAYGVFTIGVPAHWLDAGGAFQCLLYNTTGLVQVYADGQGGFPCGLTVHQLYRVS